VELRISLFEKGFLRVNEIFGPELTN